VKGLSASTPIVIFAHMPLWTIYPDVVGALATPAASLYVKRFGSVTVLNGHSTRSCSRWRQHTFQTARSTAYPQPEAARPKHRPAHRAGDQLKQMLGLRRELRGGHAFRSPSATRCSPTVGGDYLGRQDRHLHIRRSKCFRCRLTVAPPEARSSHPAARRTAHGGGLCAFFGRHPLAGNSQAQPRPKKIEISNFSFAPAALTVPVGTTLPGSRRRRAAHRRREHTVQVARTRLPGQFLVHFTTPGKFQYFCTIHGAHGRHDRCRGRPTSQGPIARSGAPYGLAIGPLAPVRESDHVLRTGRSRIEPRQTAAPGHIPASW